MKRFLFKQYSNSQCIFGSFNYVWYIRSYFIPMLVNLFISCLNILKNKF